MSSKVSALTALTGANVDALADVLAIVDNSVTQTKKILPSELAGSLLEIGTPVTLSGTSAIFSGLPAWAKKITFMLSGVSTSGTSPLELVFDIHNGSYSTSVGTRTTETYDSSGIFQITQVMVAARTYSGSVTLNRESTSGALFSNWTSRGVISADSGAAAIHVSSGFGQGTVAPSSITIRTHNLSDTFDAGEVNILYE